MSPAARKSATQRKTTVPASKKRASTKRGPRSKAELREAAKQDVSRVKALEALYRPLREAAEAELEKTKSGRKLLEETHAFATELDELHEGIRSGRTSAAEAEMLRREREEEFRVRHDDQLVEAQSRHASLQPSVEAVAQILRPEMAAQTTWVSETSPFRSMLLQPKATPEDVGTVSQGLGDPRRPPPPPIVQLSATPPWQYKEEHFLLPPFINDMANPAEADETTGVTSASGRAMATYVVSAEAALASAFVGNDFPVPKGPTSYEARITYDWACAGGGYAYFGCTVVNVDVAIVVDRLDGTRETHAWETSMLTLPVFGQDQFSHEVTNATSSYPFTRNGLQGTTRIWVGVDGHVTTVAFAGGGSFFGRTVVREICLNSVD